MLCAWVACLAILFSVLAPSISHALAAATPTSASASASASAPGLMVICRSDGATLATPAANDRQPAALQHHLEHCPYCMTHGGSFALLPTSAHVFPLLAGHDFYPPLFYRAPAPLFSWSAARPRGPPAAA
ncbi:DUF2946 domain-containing protein [Rugamonas sp. CCM 8940]|uniref:DUF2946 domain-containing protein n=1 Tax=Rugamonas sp. CCM 8940 TaxID=2765359 RepID=UPI001F1B2188|nr:DUF2946 domain-containing protein [Rugamonas sp. CCM 8940]